MVRNCSWPAVSQICSFTCRPSRSTVLILKSMPIADERRTERVVRVAQQQRGLADGAVADHQQLDLQIKRPRRRHGRATRGNAPKE